MISFPRERAGPFKALAGRCRAHRKRLVPPLRVTADGSTVTLVTGLGETALALTVPHVSGTGSLVVPMSLLDVLDGPGDGSVELTSTKSCAVVARWSDHGRAREATVEAVDADEWPDVPEYPENLSEVPPQFILALHEAGRSAARVSTRYVVERIQIQGQAGRVIATDTHQALIQSGFTFPFPEDLLIPAVPVFGSKELRGGPVRVGRTSTHLVVTVGPWTVWLAINNDGVFPNVLGIVPRTGTVVELAEADARFLKDVLPTLAKREDEDEIPVTLDTAGGRVVVRARDRLGHAGELPLPASTATGPTVRIAVVRDQLLRLVVLGFRTLRLNATKPLVAFDDAGRTYIASLLDASSEIASPRGTPPEATVPDSPPRSEVTPMKPTETNGHPTSPAKDGPDLLAEAEALRDLLADAAAQADRLVAALKLKKKETKTLNQVLSSLKSLNLGS